MFGATDDFGSWGKLLDLGVSAVVLLALVFLSVKIVIPKYMQQQHDLLATMMKSWQDEAQKARDMAERLMLAIGEAAASERKNNRESLGMIIEEWKSTRQQFHQDAVVLSNNLEAIAKLSDEFRKQNGLPVTGGKS